MTAIRRAYHLFQRLDKKRVNHRRRRIGQDTIRKFEPPYKLHIACGLNKFEGWVNLDVTDYKGVVDMVWDATQPFFIPDESCSLIYNEHFLEHLPVECALSFLTECRRLLEPSGTLRIAMPSLEETVKKYGSTDWRNQEWLTSPTFQFIQSRAEMINIAFRWWGHQWLYDSEELHRRLREAGFDRIRDVEWGSSDVTDLRNRETRADSLLICEAQK